MNIRKTTIATAISALISAPLAAQQLEEVVVTAQKRTESLQDVPVAVSAVTGEQMQELGWDRPNDIATQVPNMQVSAPLGDAQPLFSIRGISMIDYSPSQSSPVGVYMDEAYLGATYTHGMAMFDLERIEILRGPQGTLYGKNTTGGAINLITRTPDIDAETSGHITLGAGNYGMQTANGALEGSLSDTLSGRIAFKYKKDDGYMENLLGGDDIGQTNYTTVRGTLNYEPTDNFAAVFKITVGDSDGRSPTGRSESTLGGPVNIAGALVSPGVHKGYYNRVEDTEVEMSTYNLKLTYDWEDWSIVSVSSYYDAEYFSGTDNDASEAKLLAVDFAAEGDAWSQDIRLVSNFDGPFTFIGGLYIGKEDIDTRILHVDFLNDPAVVPPFLHGLAQTDRLFDVEKESLAAYTHMTYEFGDSLRATLGLRYTEDENTRDYINYSRLDTDGNPVGSWLPGNILAGPFIAAGFDAPFVTPDLSAQTGLPVGMYLDGPYTTASGEVRSVKEDAVTGKFALDYTLNDDAMIYGSYSRGFRSGSFNNGLMYADQKNENGAYAEPEYVDAWELGFKSEFMDGTLRLNGTAFYMDYQDQQFINQIGISAQLVNAGGVDIYGAEFELIALVSDGLTIQAGLGILDSEYSELELPAVSTPDPLDTVNLKGNTPVSAPDVNFNFAVDYEFDLGGNWASRLHFDGSYTDDQWFSAYNDQDGYENIRQDDYWLFNARASLFDADGKYNVSLWVQNLTDEEYDIYAIRLAAFTTEYFLEGKPKMYGVEFTYNF